MPYIFRALPSGPFGPALDSRPSPEVVIDVNVWPNAAEPLRASAAVVLPARRSSWPITKKEKPKIHSASEVARAKLPYSSKKKIKQHI